MADVRLLIQEEGRTARNLVAFNVPLGTSNTERVTRKPPSIPRTVQAASVKRSVKTTARVRSASTGRDKKSELQARYWAFLFGNLQRAVDGIYQTCEEDESISECKEVILVLENYTRDFHNLIEWFRVKWAYENSPPPLRHTPLAWEVRKTSPGRIWNSAVVPKSTSPLQRTSPTCGSPIDQTIIENKSTDGKISLTKEETAHKTLKDNKNSVSRNGTRNLREISKTVADRSNDQATGVMAKSVSAKVTAKSVLKRPTIAKRSDSTTDLKTLAEVAANAKNSVDVKNVVINTSNESRNSEKCTKIIAEHGKPNAKPKIHNVTNGKVDVEDALFEKKMNVEVKEDDKILRNHEKGSKNLKVLPNNAENLNIQSVNEVNNVKRGEVEVGDVSATNDYNNKMIGKSMLQPSPANTVANKMQPKAKPVRPAYSTVSKAKSSEVHQAVSNFPETPKMIRSKTTLGIKGSTNVTKVKPGTSVMVRRKLQPSMNEVTTEQQSNRANQDKDLRGSVEVLTKQIANAKARDEGDGWQTVRSRYRRGSTHNLIATRFHKPSSAMSLPALSIESPSEKSKKNCLTPDGNQSSKRRSPGGKTGKNTTNKVEKAKGDGKVRDSMSNRQEDGQNALINLNETNSTSVIAAIFKNEAELLEKRIQQFMAAQAERERIIIEEERKTEEADSQRSQQLSDEEASLQRQILELESTEIDVDTETDETDGETILETESDGPIEQLTDDTDDISLEDRYENMLEGMSWAERMDTLAQLQALVARHPGRALELHQKLSSPSRKRSLPETLRRYQVKQACAQHKRQKLLMEKSQRLRELLNKVEDVKSAKSQLIEDKRMRMEMKLKRAEENRTQHLLEVVRKAHDEESKLKEIAFINELEAQNKRHDFMALCQEQEERLQGIHEERQRRQEEKAAKEAAAEERRRALEAERQLRIQKMRQARREREERVGKMQLEREKERLELAREKARDREERLSALHAAQLANQEELQKKIAQKQQESARRHGENIEQIRQRAVESSILRSEEVPPTLKSYPVPKQCSLCDTVISNEVLLLSHLKGKLHLEAVRKMHDGREPPRDELQRFNISQIRDITISPNTNNNVSDNKAAKEKQKAMKRRCRKMKQRMALRGQEWENAQKDETVRSTIESANKSKFRRNLKELDRLCSNHSKTTWSSVAIAGLERCLGEIARAFDKSCISDQDSFGALNGFDTLTNLLNFGLSVQNASNGLPNKSIVSVCRVYKAAVNGHEGNIESTLSSNKILVILDLLLQRLEAITALDDHTQSQEACNGATGNGAVAIGAMQLFCSLIPEVAFEKPALQSRLQDIVGYLVAGGLVDRVSRHSRALIETDSLLDQDRETPLLLASYELLARLCCHLKRCGLQENGHGDANAAEQATAVRSHFLGGLASTEVAGAVGALYAALALSSQNQKGASPTPSQIGPAAAARALAVRGLLLLKAMAQLDLQKFQNLLGTEGTSLQWRLTASHLITRLSRDTLPDKQEAGSAQPATSGTLVLSELFVVLGYFAVNNSKNQLVLQSAGAGPSVLQQLCSLPFPFYGDPRLASATLPTLLAATHRNAEATAILSCELSYQLLEEYRNSEEGKLNSLVRLLRDEPSL